METKKRLSRSLWRASLTTAVFAVAVGSLAACGHVGDTGSASTGAASELTANQKTAAANVEAAKELPKFAPNPPVDMKPLAGKKIIVLASTLAVPFVANIANGAAEAAGVVGWEATVIDGKGSVTEWSRVVNQAVAQQIGGILTVGASPAQFAPAVAAAKAAGIPVVDVLTADQEKDPLIDGTFSHVSISFYDSGKLQADYVIANGKPDAHILVFGDNEFPGEVTRVEGMKDEFAKLCPDCEVTVQDTQVASLSTDLQRTTQTLLRRDPKIEWVLPTYDAQGLYIVAGIKTAGLASTVKVVGSDAVSDNLELVAKGDVQVADIGEPDVWSGWAGIDMMGRAMAGQQPVDPNIPLRLFDKENLAGLDVKSSDSLFGGTFRDDYKKVWGIE
jgi:ribose transport system substrate-binding protein